MLIIKKKILNALFYSDILLNDYFSRSDRSRLNNFLNAVKFLF